MRNPDEVLAVENQDRQFLDTVHHKAIRECHQDCMKHVQAHVAEVFMQYEMRLTQVLNVAMQMDPKGDVAQIPAGDMLTANAPLPEENMQELPNALNEAPQPLLAAVAESSREPATAASAPGEDGSSISEQSEPPQPFCGVAPEPAGLDPKDNNGNKEQEDQTAAAKESMDDLEEAKRAKNNVLMIDANAYLENLDENVYRVENFYKETGFAQSMARHWMFQDLTLFVISLNAIYLGIDAEFNDADLLANAHFGFILSENLFCIYFTFEITIRFLAFEVKTNCLKDGWFKFDSFLVALMILEVWGILIANAAGAHLAGLPTAPLKLLRLLRLSRLVRLLRSLPELVTMIKGMRTASRAVASSLLMVCLLVYVFSIIMMMMAEPLMQGDDELDKPNHEAIKFRWDGLAACMWTLLMDGSFMFDAGGVLHEFRKTESFLGYVAVLVFMFFMLLTSLTVLNMLIGVLCEVVTAVGQNERDEADVRLVKQGILRELLQFDDDGSGTISQVELEHVMSNNRARAVLDELEVDQSSLDEIHGMLFKHPDDQVSIKTILETCLMYRGSQPPTVKHLVDGMVFNRFFIEKCVRDCTAELTRTMVRQTHDLEKKILDERVPHEAAPCTSRDQRFQAQTATAEIGSMQELQQGLQDTI